MSDHHLPLYFGFFTEIGIISQLSRNMLENSLPSDMTVHHFSVVNHLARVSDGATPIALARAFQVPKTSMSHTIAGLTQRGLVEMRPNPKDGRSKKLWLTEAGRGFLEQVIARFTPDVQETIEAVPPQMMAEIMPQLSEIRRRLDALRDVD